MPKVYEPCFYENHEYEGAPTELVGEDFEFDLDLQRIEPKTLEVPVGGGRHSIEVTVEADGSLDAIAREWYAYGLRDAMRSLWKVDVARSEDGNTQLAVATFLLGDDHPDQEVHVILEDEDPDGIEEGAPRHAIISTVEALRARIRNLRGG